MNRKPPAGSPPPFPPRPPRRALLTGKQAGAFLGVTERFMARHREHKIPHVHVGRFLRYPPEELEEWVRVGEDAFDFTCPRCEELAANPRPRRPRQRRPDDGGMVA